MPFWRKKIDAGTFGGYLLWDLAKYGKGAEAGLTELVESDDELASVDKRLRDAGVHVTTRQRYQLFFTALMGQIAFHSLKEKYLDKLKAGFKSEFPQLNQELSGVLGCDPADLKETHHFSELCDEVIRRNAIFQRTGDLLNQEAGFEGSLCEELGILLLDKALAESAALENGIQSREKRSRCLRKLSITMLAAYREGSLQYKQVKLM